MHIKVIGGNRMTNVEMIGFIVVAFIVARIPVIGKYFKSLNTMFHEDGHIVMSLLTFGKAYKIELFANTEGVATTGSRFWLGKVLTSMAGYPFASFMAFVFYYFFVQAQFDVLFYGLAVVVVINLLLWVRNWYGIIWLISFIGLLGGLYYLGNNTYIQYALFFVGAIMLVESIASAFTILRLSFKTPNDAGDTTNLRKYTWLSARFWGILFFSQSLYFGYLIIDMTLLK